MFEEVKKKKNWNVKENLEPVWRNNRFCLDQQIFGGNLPKLMYYD